MSQFKEKLHGFLKHYDALNELGEDADDGFNAEFIQLKQETQQYKENNTFPAEAGQQPFNKKKNRFKDILPYEYTRVQLHRVEGIEGSDYINANYVQGADSNVTYIAAQGPLPHTVDDFWRMLWYHQIEIVVMACKLVELGRKKCEQYWPALGESQMFGPIKVTMMNEESISDDFTIRELIAECQGDEQIIRQYHYNAWPDHGRPHSALPIIRMIERIGDHRKRRDIPIVVHCSAGCGRTGTIIAIDYARTQLLSEELQEDLSVHSIVHEMRKQRPSMVQAKEQYVFVYIAVAELIKRILGNVPQAPPKQLNFEKKETDRLPVFNDNNIYQNLSDMQTSEKRKSTGSLDTSPTRTAPSFPPKPVTRTSSAGRTENTSSRDNGKPLPPVKPLKPKPERPAGKPTIMTSLDTPPKKDVPEPAPRMRKTDNSSHPVPAPRKMSPINPPLVSQSTPVSKGYVNVPKTGTQPQGEGTESTYSVVTKPTPPPTAEKPKSTSNSILDTLIMECGDAFSEKELSNLSDPTQELSYSLLGTVSESEIPPDIPVQTADSMQLIIGEKKSPDKNEQLNALYETPDPSLLSAQPQSTSLAFSSPVMRTSQDDLSSKSKKGKTISTGGLFKKGTPQKDRDMKTATHPGIGRTPSSGLSPTKRATHPTPTKRGGPTDRFQFPGEMGFGIRIGKPKGPRQTPSHWSYPNGLIH